MIRINMDLESLLKSEIEKGKNKEMDKMVVSLQHSTPKDTGEAASGWYHDGNGIHNSVEHISDLNEGTSKQAPSYFVEKTLLSHPGVKPSGTITRSK